MNEQCNVPAMNKDGTGMYVVQQNVPLNTNSAVQVSPGTTIVSEDPPLSFSTVQLYVPTMSLTPTDESMVSTVW